ncbi:MAG: hypothetical protein BGP06_17435 [Rhizobiales bacterium 65-9]|nr:MAG: hypothetical protein BGP06_17435 [Rhizobiales bacterium 65-9]
MGSASAAASTPVRERAPAALAGSRQGRAPLLAMVLERDWALHSAAQTRSGWEQALAWAALVLEQAWAHQSAVAEASMRVWELGWERLAQAAAQPYRSAN